MNLITISSVQRKQEKERQKNQTNNISVASTKVRDARFNSIFWWSLQKCSNFEEKQQQQHDRKATDICNE